MLCNLHVGSKKATEHLQNWHATSEQATSSQVPRQRNYLPMSTNVQPVFDKGSIRYRKLVARL